MSVPSQETFKLTAQEKKNSRKNMYSSTVMVIF